MPEELSAGGYALVAKILTVSGLLFIVVGALVALFANIPVGVVIGIVGVFDLGAAVFFSKKATSGETPGGSDSP